MSDEHPVVRASRRANAAHLAGDWEVLAECFADDLIIEDRRQGFGATFTKEENLAQAKVMAELGVVRIDTEPVEMRDERRGVVRLVFETAEGFVVSALSVTEIDADGRIMRAAIFDEHELDAARAELGRLSS